MASARTSRRPVSRTRTILAAAAAASALAGCSATNPITTADAYNVVDGVQADVTETVAARNLLVLTSEEGAEGVMTGALTNQGRDDVEVELSPEGGDSVTLDVPAGGTVLLGSENGEEVEIDEVPVQPGALMTVTASTPDGGTHEILVPVFDGTLPEYSEIVPEAS